MLLCGEPKKQRKQRLDKIRTSRKLKHTLMRKKMRRSKNLNMKLLMISLRWLSHLGILHFLLVRFVNVKFIYNYSCFPSCLIHFNHLHLFWIKIRLIQTWETYEKTISQENLWYWIMEVCAWIYGIYQYFHKYYLIYLCFWINRASLTFHGQVQKWLSL